MDNALTHPSVKQDHTVLILSGWRSAIWHVGSVKDAFDYGHNFYQKVLLL